MPFAARPRSVAAYRGLNAVIEVKIQSVFVLALCLDHVAHDPVVAFDEENAASVRRWFGQTLITVVRAFEKVESILGDPRITFRIRPHVPIKDSAGFGRR